MFVSKGPISNIPALVQIMAWRRPGDKPMIVRLPTHICVTRLKWGGINKEGFMSHSFPCGRISTVCVTWISKKNRKCKYSFVFPQNHIVHKMLTRLSKLDNVLSQLLPVRFLISQHDGMKRVSVHFSWHWARRASYYDVNIMNKSLLRLQIDENGGHQY